MEKQRARSSWVTDPVCAMDVNPKQMEHTFSYRDHTYYFCSGGCREAFEADPEQYVNRRPAKRKGWWGRYLDRLSRTTGGRPQRCC